MFKARGFSGIHGLFSGGRKDAVDFFAIDGKFF